MLLVKEMARYDICLGCVFNTEMEHWRESQIKNEDKAYTTSFCKYHNDYIQHKNPETILPDSLLGKYREWYYQGENALSKMGVATTCPFKIEK